MNISRTFIGGRMPLLFATIVLLFLMICVWNVHPFVQNDGNGAHPYTYSFVHLSDIQTLTTAYPSALDLTFRELEDLKPRYNISAVFITGDLTNEYDGGPGDGADFSRYAHAVSLTSIPVYEIAGNHDVPEVGDYTAWDTHIPSGSKKHSYGRTFNDFRVYGFGWSGDDSISPDEINGMRMFLAADPSKIALILTHPYFVHDGWQNGTRAPVAYDILDSLNESAIVLCGHSHTADKGGLIRRTVYRNITVIEDLINYQDWGEFSGGRLYTITTDGTRISGLQISDLYLYPDRAVRNTESYNLSLVPVPSLTATAAWE